ncbi:MAG TPA: alanine racemase [Thermoanaerobaculia bacterium]|nr:alanine racemase [Thermoanaerobaculia bacterium]
MKLSEVPTPAFVLDLGRARRNCDVMRAKAERSGVAFRPHVKTHKTVEGALLQHGGRPGPVTVSTLAEAELLAGAGFDDMTWALPIDPGKLSRAADLAARVRLHLLVDHPDALSAMEEFARSHGIRFRAFLKVDSGARRSGVDPEEEASVLLARRILASSEVELSGLLTHAGHSYHCRNAEQILRVAEQEAAVLTRFRERVGARQLVRSVGSTPTASIPDVLPDTDEVRPGNYVFFDAFQATIGSCTLDHCAASVLVSVLSHYPGQNKIVVDGGALALSKDAGPTHVDPDFGFGIVTDLAGARLPMRVRSISQEHGQIVGEAPIELHRHPIGSKLRIVPNHSCLTAAQFERFTVVEGDRVVDEWRPARGW